MAAAVTASTGCWTLLTPAWFNSLQNYDNHATTPDCCLSPTQTGSCLPSPSPIWVLSKGYRHGGLGVCLGDGQTEAGGVLSQGGRGDAQKRLVSRWDASCHADAPKSRWHAKCDAETRYVTPQRIMSRWNAFCHAASRIVTWRITLVLSVSDRVGHVYSKRCMRSGTVEN